MLYAIIFGGIALFTFVIGGWAYWAGNQRSTEVTAFARARGLDLVAGRQEVEPDPSFALLRPARVLQRYVIERMAWPGDDDSVFVFTAKWRDLGAETDQTLIRTCVRVRLPVDAPSVRFGRSGWNRDWLTQPFGTSTDAQKIATGDAEFDGPWTITTPDPVAAAELLTPDVRRWLVNVASERPNVEMELNGRWLLCDVGPKSTSLEDRLEWLAWAKEVPTKLFDDS